jgi:hypothetical protein
VIIGVNILSPKVYTNVNKKSKTTKEKMKDVPQPALVVFDGTSYFGIFAFDLEDMLKEEPELEVISRHSYWSDAMDEEIENLNNEI